MHYKDITSYLQGEEHRISLLKKSDIFSPLIIDKLYLSVKQRGEDDYSVTKEVDTLEIDEYGILGDRHRGESHFRQRLREGHIYPKGSQIRQERHFLIGTHSMLDRISEKMGIEVSPELLGWNVVLRREDGKQVVLDGLPIGTDFMIYPPETTHIETKEERENLIVNLRLATYQMGCGITGASIANSYDDRSQIMNFVDNSRLYRGAIFAIDGPKGNHTIQVGQKVFIGIPTGYIH